MPVTKCQSLDFVGLPLFNLQRFLWIISPAEAQISLKLVENILKSDDPPPLRLKKIHWTLMRLRVRALTNGLRLLIGEQGLCAALLKI